VATDAPVFGPDTVTVRALSEQQIAIETSHQIIRMDARELVHLISSAIRAYVPEAGAA
jgi:hypothetical protein